MREDAFERAFAGFKPGKRHPAEVTVDRLGGAVGKYRHLITGAEADAFAQVIQILTEIAEGERS